MTIIMRIRYTRNITSNITMVQEMVDKKVIKLNTCPLEVIKSYFMTRNNKLDMFTAAIRMTCN